MPTGRRVFETLVIRLAADTTLYQTGLIRAQRATNTFAGQLTRFGGIMTSRVTIPLTLMGGAAVLEFARFDKAMKESLAIMSGVTPQMEAQLSRVARTMSTQSVTSAEELAKSYFFLTSAGLGVAESLKALPIVNKFAIAGMFEMSEATDLLTDAQSALGLTIRGHAELNGAIMKRLGDILVSANQQANATTRQFAVALVTKAAPAMKLHNIAMEEGIAVLAAYADQGIKAENAGNAYDRALRLLAKGAVEAKAAHDLFGFSVHDASGEMRKMSDIVDNLDDVLRGLSDDQKTATLIMLGFQARSQQVITPLLQTGDAIRKYEASLKAAGNTMAEVAEKNMQSFSAQLTITWNQIKDIADGIGRRLVPVIQIFQAAIKSLHTHWIELNEVTKTALVVMGGYVSIVGPAILAYRSLAGALTLLGTEALFAGNSIAFMNKMLKVGAMLGVAFAAKEAVAWFRGLDDTLREVNKNLEKAKALAEAFMLKTMKKQEDELFGLLDEDDAEKRKKAIAQSLDDLNKTIFAGDKRMWGMREALLKQEGNMMNWLGEKWHGRENAEKTALKADIANQQAKLDQLEEHRKVLKQLAAESAKKESDQGQTTADRLKASGIDTTGGSGAALKARISEEIKAGKKSVQITKDGAMQYVDSWMDAGKRYVDGFLTRSRWNKKKNEDAAREALKVSEKAARDQKKLDQEQARRKTEFLRKQMADAKNILSNAKNAFRDKGSILDFFLNKDSSTVAKGDLHKDTLEDEHTLLKLQRETAARHARDARIRGKGKLGPGGFAMSKAKKVKAENRFDKSNAAIIMIEKHLLEIRRKESGTLEPALFGP